MSSGAERDDVLLLVRIVACDDGDEEEVASVRLHRMLQPIAPVVDRPAADDVDRALELAVRVRLGLALRRHDDQVEREVLRARGLSGDPEEVRDLLLRLECHRAPHPYRTAVPVDLRTRGHCTPPRVMDRGSSTLRSFSSGMTFSSSAMSRSDRLCARAFFTRSAAFA